MGVERTIKFGIDEFGFLNNLYKIFGGDFGRLVGDHASASHGIGATNNGEKVLAWKFDIINVLEITNKLEKEKLISRKAEQGLSKYEITEKGKEFIEVNMIMGKSLILEKYKQEQSFITSLLSH